MDRLRAKLRRGSYPWIDGRLKVLALSLMLGICLILIADGKLILGRGPGGEESSPGPRRESIGVVDVELLMQSHPNYPQLEAVGEQLMIHEQNWVDYIHLLARQAAVDGIRSPVLEKLMGLEQPAAVEQVIDKAKRERAEYQEKLAQELGEEIEERIRDIEKASAQQADRLQREAKREFLNRQVELAMLSLTEKEAEALLDEIAKIQAGLESDLAELEEAANGQLQAEIERAQEAAGEKLAAFDRDMAAQVESELSHLQTGSLAAADMGNSLEPVEHPGHLEAMWAAELAGRYQLNTKAADALEAQVLKEWERARGHMQPLRGRYNQLYGQILEDVTADIAQAGREAGLMVILDKNQADIQAADITNQVLDILQGEA